MAAGVVEGAQLPASARTTMIDCVPIGTTRQSPAAGISSSRATAIQPAYQNASSSRS